MDHWISGGLVGLFKKKRALYASDDVCLWALFMTFLRVCPLNMIEYVFMLVGDRGDLH